MNDLRAKGATVSREARTLVLTVALFGGIRVAFPLARIKSFTSARVRAAGDGVLEVTVEDRGATIVWPKLDIDFSVAEMLPYLGIVTLRASARRAGKATSQAKTLAARVNGAKGVAREKLPESCKSRSLSPDLTRRKQGPSIF